MAQGQKPHPPQTERNEKQQERGQAQGDREEQMGETSPADLEQERVRGTQLDQKKPSKRG